MATPQHVVAVKKVFDYLLKKNTVKRINCTNYLLSPFFLKFDFDYYLMQLVSRVVKISLIKNV